MTCERLAQRAGGVSVGVMLLLVRSASAQPTAREPASQPAEIGDARRHEVNQPQTNLEAAPQAHPAEAQRPKRPTDGIRDNSFFVEEAFNQEPGVVQHIFGFRFGIDDRGTDRVRSWDLTFTQEWPLFSRAHQLSYTIPYSFLDPAQREHDGGVGDILLNYRYELVNNDELDLAVTPRISLILPTGDEDRGYGSGVTGYQFNLAASKTLSDRLYVNFNAGFTHLPGSTLRFSNGRRSEERNLYGFNLGAGAIWAVREDFNVMLEAVWFSDQGLDERPSAGGRRLFLERARANDVVISPGVRWAWNLPGDLQVVPGIAFPIGLSDEAIDYGVFFYLSLEHPFVSTQD